MLNDILLITAIVLTRIAFPIIATLVLGYMLERVLHSDPRNAQG